MRINRSRGRGVRIAACASVYLFIMLTGASVLAHVEKGPIPDSVAEMEYRIILEFTPGDTTTRSLLGMALLRQNKLTEAEKEFRQILQLEAKNFDALDGLGLVMFNAKRPSDALPHLLAAIKVRPDDIMVHLHLGRVLASIGQSEKARETLTTGLNLLGKQKPGATKERQLAEFKAALAALPKKAGAATLQ